MQLMTGLDNRDPHVISIYSLAARGIRRTYFIQDVLQDENPEIGRTLVCKLSAAIRRSAASK